VDQYSATNIVSRVSKGESLVINQAVKDNLSAQGFDIKVLTPIVCGMKFFALNFL